MNSIIWKGVSSTTIQGLLISELPPITKPEMRIKETVIDGMDGSIIEELGYASYVKTVTIGLYGNFDINKVIKYFTGEGDIIFSNEPDKVYRAKICGKIDYTRLLRYRQASIPFMVQPFKYKLNEYLRETTIASTTGTIIATNNSTENKLKSVKICGKSTQNGTPTPSAPINIVSVADDGNIGVRICGKNLVDSIYGEYIPLSLPSGTLLTASCDNPPSDEIKIMFYDSQKNRVEYYALNRIAENGRTYATFTLNNDVEYLMFAWATVNTITNAQLTLGDDTEYEPYEEQVEYLSTHNGLMGIPVTDKSLATYTDTSEKMWCADEIDLTRGVMVQRVHREIIDGSKSVNECTIIGDTLRFYMRIAYKSAMTNCISNKLPYMHNYRDDSEHIYVPSKETYVYIFINTNRLPTADAVGVKTYLANNPIEIMYTLDEPIETALTEEEIATYKALVTDRPTATISNDENAYMMVEYFKPFEVFNEGLEDSKPLMILKGSGTVEISVNGLPTFSYTFPEGENEVYIDSEKEDAYLGTELKNRNMNGEFPILIPKTNIIEWSGDIESISILPRSRWL